MEKVRIGFDLGGTNMGAALVSDSGKILFEVSSQTLAHEPRVNILSRMKRIIGDCIEEAKLKNLEVTGIGFGCPGLIDSDKGIIRVSPNIPDFQNLEICSEISGEFNLPVAIDNDVRVATLGEYFYGAGRGYKNILCITIGTGIGGGLIINEKLLRGPTQSIGEIGHMTLKKDGPLCGCGNYGCLEALSSGTAIVRDALLAIKNNPSTSLAKCTSEGNSMSTYLVAKEAEKGDPEASGIMREAGEWLGIGLANIINFLNPEIIIIGGGVALAGDLLFDPMREEISKRAFKIPADFVKIVPAALSESAGIIGASTLVG